LTTLPGIGNYTAGAIASICFDLPTPAVDGNVLRIISRITENFNSIDQDSTKKEISGYLAEVYPAGYYGDFTQSLIELGATVCLPNGAPLCGKCPAYPVCLANHNGTTVQLPVKKEKKPRKLLNMTVFIIRSGTKIALRKRTARGVLNGLWEFPNIEGTPDDASVKEKLSEFSENGAMITNIVLGKHIFTHIEWHMTCYFMDCIVPFGNAIWIDEAKLEEEIALPTAFRKFWEKHAEDIQMLDFVL
jgi:A/G-specific adenine glycosylase